MVEACYRWLDQLTNEMSKPGFKIHDTDHWESPEEGMGYGFHEALRGALLWFLPLGMRHQGTKRDRGKPYEEALIGVPCPDPDNPINLLRVIRSFDPCLGCAIDVIDPRSNEVKSFIV